MIMELMDQMVKKFLISAVVKAERFDISIHSGLIAMALILQKMTWKLRVQQCLPMLLI